MSDVQVLVRVFFWGLIAFVPDNEIAPTKLTALLVDAATPQLASDGCPVFPHAAKLYYPLPSSGGLCDKSRGCAPEEHYCVCRLDRVDIEIPAVPGGAPAKGDFPLVTSMSRISQLKAPVKSVFLDQVSRDKPIPRVLAARAMNLSVNGSIKAVAMVGESAGHKSEAYFAFESLIDQPTFVMPHRECRMAEAISVPMLVPGKEDSGKVTIEILTGKLDFGGGSAVPLPIEAAKCGNQYCADLYIINEMDEKAFRLSRGFCHDEGIGRHFELFYGLSRRDIDTNGRDIPKRVVGRCGRSYSPATSQLALAPRPGPELSLWLKFLAEIGRAGEHRPICPMVTMSE